MKIKILLGVLLGLALAIGPSISFAEGQEPVKTTETPKTTETAKTTETTETAEECPCGMDEEGICLPCEEESSGEGEGSDEETGS